MKLITMPRVRRNQVDSTRTAHNHSPPTQRQDAIRRRGAGDHHHHQQQQGTAEETSPASGQTTIFT